VCGRKKERHLLWHPKTRFSIKKERSFIRAVTQKGEKQHISTQ